MAVQPIDPTALSPPAETQLSDLLSQGTALALQRGIELLSVSPDPFDRSHAQLLKTQSAYAVHFLNTKLRVDEETLRSQRDESRSKRVAEIVERIKEAVALGKKFDAERAQRAQAAIAPHDDGDGHDDGEELECP